MRKIEFRGKSIKTRKWAYGYLVKDEGSDYAPEAFIVEAGTMGSNGEIYGDIIKVIPKTVGQFTGLKDKQDKDLYEGDLVTANSLSGIGEVCWKETGWAVGAWPLHASFKYNLKIVGNKFDNPELLKEVLE